MILRDDLWNMEHCQTNHPCRMQSIMQFWTYVFGVSRTWKAQFSTAFNILRHRFYLRYTPFPITPDMRKGRVGMRSEPLGTAIVCTTYYVCGFSTCMAICRHGNIFHENSHRSMMYVTSTSFVHLDRFEKRGLLAWRLVQCDVCSLEQEGNSLHINRLLRRRVHTFNFSWWNYTRAKLAPIYIFCIDIIDYDAKMGTTYVCAISKARLAYDGWNR